MYDLAFSHKGKNRHSGEQNMSDKSFNKIPTGFYNLYYYKIFQMKKLLTVIFKVACNCLHFSKQNY